MKKYSIKLDIKGKNLQVTVTNNDTKEQRKEVRKTHIGSPEEYGRAIAKDIIKLWKSEETLSHTIEYESD